MQYYTADRYAVYAHLSPGGANLIHHAVELLMKAAIGRGKRWDEILTFGGSPKHGGMGHELPLLWAAYTALPESDATTLMEYKSLTCTIGKTSITPKS
jgi:hypothetical protein